MIRKPQASNEVNTLKCQASGNQGDQEAHIRLDLEAEGPWLVALTAHGDVIRNAKLVATYEDKPAGTATLVKTGQPAGISLEEFGTSYHRIAVPTGAARLSVTVSNASSLGELFVRHANLPTVFLKHAFEPFIESDPATVVIDDPQPGEWFIRVDGLGSTTQATLTATVD